MESDMKIIWKGEGFGRHCEIPAEMLEDENPLVQIWRAHKELNDRIAELDGLEVPSVKWMPVRLMVETVDDEPNPYLQAIATMEARVKPAKVCECGVAITGGLHSDWCQLHEEPSL